MKSYKSYRKNLGGINEKSTKMDRKYSICPSFGLFVLYYLFRK